MELVYGFLLAVVCVLLGSYSGWWFYNYTKKADESKEASDNGDVLPADFNDVFTGECTDNSHVSDEEARLILLKYTNDTQAIEEFIKERRDREKSRSECKNPLLPEVILAIDFEYLVKGRLDSPCQVGAVKVVDGIISERYGTLIYTDVEGELSYGNSITREMLKWAPSFADVMEHIHKMASGATLVAHNASTEREVIRKTCELMGISSPLNSKEFVDTRKLMGGKGLADSCAELGITLDHHHDALADAEACARIYMKVKGREIEEHPVREYKPKSPVQPQEVIAAPQHSSAPIVLDGAKVVLTGTFAHYDNRDELIPLLKSAGATVTKSISGATTLIVVGGYGTTGWAKIEKAKEQGIPIISEKDLLELLK